MSSNHSTSEMAKMRQSPCLFHEETIYLFMHFLQNLHLERGTILGGAGNKTEAIPLYGDDSMGLRVGSSEANDKQINEQDDDL